MNFKTKELFPEIQPEFVFQIGRRKVRCLGWLGFVFPVFCTVLTLHGAAPEEPSAQGKSIPVAEMRRSTAVDFEREILPILTSNCLACHNQTKAKADLVLETPQTILKGGESGPAVIAGHGVDSLLLKVATHLEKPVMPPKDNKVNALNLTSDELGLVKLWIDQGAKGEVRGSGPIVWQSLADTVNPIFAVALTSDGQFAACGRGNHLGVYHLPTRQFAANLIDPQMMVGSETNKQKAAHLDVVNALAFNPDGDLLASAGYREVKLWRRQPITRSRTFTNAPGGSTLVVATSTNGTHLILGGRDGLIRIVDRISGSLLKTLDAQAGAVTALRVSPDGNRLLAAAGGNTIDVWDLATGASLARVLLKAPATAVSWTPASNHVATADATGSIHIWELSAKNPGELALLKEFKGQTNGLSSLDFVVGKTPALLTSGRDGTARSWNLEKYEEMLKFEHGGEIVALVASPDGQRIATAGTNRVIKLWNAGDGKLIAELRGDRNERQRLIEAERALTYAKGQLALRKTLLAAADKERTNQVERVTKATDAYRAAEKAHTEKQKALADATAVVPTAEKALNEVNELIKKLKDDLETAETAGTNARTGAKVALDKLVQAQLADKAAQMKAEIERIVASATGTTKATAESDVKAPPTEAQASAATEAHAIADKALDELIQSARKAGAAKVTFDRANPDAEKRKKEADEKLQAAKKSAGDAENTFKKASLTRSTSENELHLSINAAQKAGDALADGLVALQSAETDQKQRETAVSMAGRASSESEQVFRHLAFSPDGQILAASSDDGKTHTWSAATGASLASWQSGQNDSVNLAFAGASELVTSTGDGIATVWHLQPEWKLERTIGTGDDKSLFLDRVNVVRFTPDGKKLITGGGEPSRSGELKVWLVSDGTLLQDLKGVHSDVVLGLDLTADGRYLASSAADKFIRVLDLQSGKILRSLEGHTHHVLSVSWKRDGRTLISGGADNVAKVWDAFTGERKKNIDGFTKEITSVSFVGDGDEALACSGDNSLKLVKSNGEKVRSYEGATDFLQSATSALDGSVVVAGGQDGVLRFWDGASAKLVASFEK
ncbi:MAG: hypothetical protein EXS31_05940 [Pedosphaera sp.]|nr:hypothetical protein [Pedosphaera sp.]